MHKTQILTIKLLLGSLMSSFKFSTIVIIQSLDPGDFKSGTELGKYIDGLRVDHPAVPNVELIEVSGRDEFLQTIDRLRVEAEQSGDCPILQIEMHGWEDKSGIAFPDDSSLNWKELSQPLASLNRATGFNLLVCMSACFGGHSLSFVRPGGSSPCFALIGPTHSVNAGDLLGSFRALYRELLITLDANAALAKLRTHGLSQGGFVTVTAEEWFFKLADGYLREHCTEERLKARAKKLTDEMTREGKTLNTAQQAAMLQIGEQLAISFLDRRFPEFFMVDAIPSNQARFGDSLAKARQQVADFLAAQR
jgi:hypothetical protein